MVSKSSNTFSKFTNGNADTRDESLLIPLSALQHYLYCPRQCALIHVEGQWNENLYTAEGQLLHRRTDEGERDNRKGVRTVRAMPIRSFMLGVSGKTDVVEFHVEGQKEKVFPIEYKRGQPKTHLADEVQLCAQTICLEEMLDTTIPDGAIFYGQKKRRKSILFTTELREHTLDIAKQTYELINKARTPAPVYSAKLCNQCSLLEICQPRNLTRPKSVQNWLLQQIKE